MLKSWWVGEVISREVLCFPSNFYQISTRCEIGSRFNKFSYCSSTALRSWSAASVPVELCRTLRFCVSYVVGLRWITAGRGCWDDSSGTPPLADEPSGRDASNSQKLELSPGLQEFANHLCLQGPVRNFPEAWHFHGRKSLIDCRRQGHPGVLLCHNPVMPKGLWVAWYHINLPMFWTHGGDAQGI